MEQHADTRVACASCFREQTIGKLEDHVRVCINYFPFPCYLCDSRLATKDKLRYHFRRDHPGEEIKVHEDPIEEKDLEMRRILSDSYKRSDLVPPTPFQRPTPIMTPMLMQFDPVLFAKKFGFSPFGMAEPSPQNQMGGNGQRSMTSDGASSCTPINIKLETPQPEYDRAGEGKAANCSVSESDHSLDPFSSSPTPKHPKLEARVEEVSVRKPEDDLHLWAECSKPMMCVECEEEISNDKMDHVAMHAQEREQMGKMPGLTVREITALIWKEIFPDAKEDNTGSSQETEQTDGGTEMEQDDSRSLSAASRVQPSPSNGASKEPKFSCKICGVGNIRRRKEHALMKHLGLTLTCNICLSYQTPQKRTMIKHMERNHPDDSEEYADNRMELEPKLEEMLGQCFPDVRTESSPAINTSRSSVKRPAKRKK